MALSKGLTRNKETVFRTVTVLRATVPADPHRTLFEMSEFLEKGSIIGNPQISVAILYNKITIFSGLFIEALGSVVSYDTQDKLEGGKLDLDDEANAVELETRIHVELVLDYVGTILKAPIAQERVCYQRDVPTCTYRMLRYPFRPGGTVYVISDEAEDAYVVDSIEMEKFSLSSLDTKVVTIRPFKDERPITSLDAVPCKIFDKSETVTNGRAYADPTSYYGLEGNTPKFKPVSSGTSDTVTARNFSSFTKARNTDKLKMHTPGASYDNLSIKKIGSFVDDSDRRIGYLLCSRKL
ncbi:hypothetical protein B0H66DRAFT_620670 [Apodospora peruviana]|uniref:Uncharacterized protein n=1 Tax=Apodospora peruviana TaxID=516989 RepID=A0AAE0M8W2_9PEZI|nr:hypothetical protein B0H66DRAFT_620670 [Apodospora peruviana]